MFRTLWSPLRARFDISSQLPRQSLSGVDGPTPEDFAQDVLVELMRNSVEQLKLADQFEDRIKLLEEILRIMNQSSYTKGVFRETDGFICLYNVLSTVRYTDSNEVKEGARLLRLIRLVLEIVSDATFEHDENLRFYQLSIGYEPLASALETLPTNAETTTAILGLLFSFMVHDFTMENLLKGLHCLEIDTVDDLLKKYDPNPQFIRHPPALSLFWSFSQRGWTSPSLRLGLSRILGHLASARHRNLAAMSDAGLLLPILDHFRSSKDDSSVSEKERHAWKKLLRQLLELRADPAYGRVILQKTIQEGGTLDPEILDLVRYGMKSRWVDHFSLESVSGIKVNDLERKTLPNSGITFLAWIFLARMPSEYPLALFTISIDSKPVITLRIHSEGNFELSTSSNRDSVVFSKATIHRSRWTHVALVYYPSRSSSPSIRLSLDGVIQDGINRAYPQPIVKGPIIYTIGGCQSDKSPSWCISSAYLVATPIPDDLIRFIYHLGPRYVGNFQDSNLIKFLTYEASTLLNMFLATVGSKSPSRVGSSPILKALREGMDLDESKMIFSISATSLPSRGVVDKLPVVGLVTSAQAEGDVYLVKAACFDAALWTIGGAAVALRLVQLAQSPHEISRALSILTDSLRNHWQNSEDMERLRGYEILTDMLRRKGQNINLTSFEILFGFLGINPRSPEQSTIVNLGAYRALALDFELWSRTRKEVQTVYFEHFITLMETSRFKMFNIVQRFSKLNLIRKLLFALQAEWFDGEMSSRLVDTLNIACRADFSRDGAIKPIVSYLAANLHEKFVQSGSPSSSSTLPHIHLCTSRGKPEQVLEALISILSRKEFYVKFVAALPLTRICLLLLGNSPSSAVAAQILKLLNASVGFSTSFIRKFELVSGWSVLKIILPCSWSKDISDAAFDLLLGRTGAYRSQDVSLRCPQILPTILAALQSGLNAVASTSHVPENSDLHLQLPLPSPASEPGPRAVMPCSEQAATMEVLIENLLDLHSTTAQFRSLFQSHNTTQLFIDAYKSFVKSLTELSEINARALRILEKLTHFGLALALDNSVAGSQKREILDVIPTAEDILNPSTSQAVIDPGLVADNRTIRQRITSARFGLQVGERTIFKIVARIGNWRKTIQASERKILRRTILDLCETRRQVPQLQEWTKSLTSERGLWPSRKTLLWRLDETEGPNRIRKKLEAEIAGTLSSRATIGETSNRNIQEPEIEVNQNATEVPPWVETYEISTTDMDEPALSEDAIDDKLRHIRHELEPGDVIDAVATVARVVGVDSSPGLFIIGKTHLYMLDGVVETNDGEIVDAHDAPKCFVFLPGSIVELDGRQRALRWAHKLVAAHSEKSFLLRDVALEIYFKDNRSLLIVFLDKKQRTEAGQRLSNIANGNVLPSTPGLLRTPNLDDLSTATRKWQAREISNFTYISILNQVSGRTPNDATQYPVFPWILKDYTSENLNLASSSSYRDLSKPMGALTSARVEAAKTRYENLESVGEKPFHFGTHFSSSMIVCHFLIRLAPFTGMFKTLQGGDWDLPDRLFSDIARAYESAAHYIRGDVRELIPEFFTCPEFLENTANHDFGIQQSTGERIHDIKLPPWAKGDPFLFITLHRKALESDYVGENLPAWIDLIWGYKQKDPDSLNVFHPFSYEGAVNLDEITDQVEKQATAGIIHNFGQTPRKLFTTPHPSRSNHGLSTLPLGILHGIEEDPQLLTQSMRSFRDLGPSTPVKELLLDPSGEKVTPHPQGILTVPQYPHEQIEWNLEKREIRLLVDHKVVQIIENTCCTCATFIDSDHLVTGLSDYTVRKWNLHHNTNLTSSLSEKLDMTLSNIMRIHTDDVTCITASRTWSIIVSGSRDGSAVIWELNRGGYVRSIWHPRRTDGDTTVNLVAINESTGFIASCSSLALCLHTINGRPIATLDLTTHPSFYSPHVPTITSLAFHEREYSHLGILGTGAVDGIITLWTWKHNGSEIKDEPANASPRWVFTEVRRLKARNLPGGRPPCITALKFSGEKLFHGEETGKCFSWTLPDSD